VEYPRNSNHELFTSFERTYRFPHGSVIYIDRRMCAAYGPCPQGVQMDFGFVAALLIAILAIVSVFVEIPIVSDYAFWVMTGAFLLVVGIGYDRERRKKK
jgi:hypothetical protein